MNKILLVTQYFYPEDFKSNDIAFELSKLGCDVTVLTGIPNYPKGKFYDGYGLFKKKKEKIKGVNVVRSWLIPRGKGGGLRLFLNYISWASFASIKILFLSRQKKYNSIIVHEPSPITQAIPAILLKRIQKTPIYLWVLDLWPESLTSASNIKNKFILKSVLRLVQYIYNESDKILISSKGFEKSILEKGNYKDKIVYFPNWAEEVFDKIPLTEQNIPTWPKGFTIMFAGNIGEAQDFENILKAILLLDNEEINFVIVGDGRKKVWVENFVKENKLDRVYLLGRYPLETMPIFFQKADAMLVSLKDEPIFNLTIPAKIQAYMMAGKPIVAMLNGDGADTISEAKCGIVVNAGDYKKLAESIKDLKEMSLSEIEKYGKNSRLYYENNFKKETCIKHLHNIIHPNKK